MPADYLYTLANQLLMRSLAGLALARTGKAPPTRSYVSHNEPAWDACTADQLTVHYDPRPAIENRPVKPGGRGMPKDCNITPVATLWVTLIRCLAIPDEGVPTAAALDAENRQLLIDLWALQTQHYSDWRAGVLLPGVPRCDVRLLSPMALGPEGAVAGWRTGANVLLNDTGPVVVPAS